MIQHTDENISEHSEQHTGENIVNNEQRTEHSEHFTLMKRLVNTVKQHTGPWRKH